MNGHLAHLAPDQEDRWNFAAFSNRWTGLRSNCSCSFENSKLDSKRSLEFSWEIAEICSWFYFGASWVYWFIHQFIAANRLLPWQLIHQLTDPSYWLHELCPNYSYQPHFGHLLISWICLSNREKAKRYYSNGSWSTLFAADHLSIHIAFQSFELGYNL